MRSKMADLNELNEKVEQIKADIREQLEKIENTKGVYEYKKTILDKNGIIGGLMKQMGSVPKEEKADFGKKVNELKNWASEHFDELNTKLKEKEMELRYESEKIDISMPAKSRKTGNLHPVTQVRNQLIDIFASMGFSVYEGTEIETDYYNFTALNTPQDHPARDMQDTFYLSPEFLLRTQTSAGQVHVMENQKPPIKILSPGKVFRPFSVPCPATGRNCLFTGCILCCSIRRCSALCFSSSASCSMAFNPAGVQAQPSPRTLAMRFVVMYSPAG